METRTIVLNLQPRTTIQVMKVSQYDVGIPMSFIIYDGANPATIASGTTVTLQMTRPSGISYSRTGSISGNVVSMSTTLDMTRESGDIEAELRFVRSSEDVGTCNFTLSVEPAAKKDDAIDADTEALQLIADQVRADTNQSTTNAKNAKTAESNAKSYATSAKTNADIATAAAKSAGKSATEAAESEQTALDAATRAEAAADRLIPDPTLTLEGMPAEAKATGEAISTLEQNIGNELTNLKDDLNYLIESKASIDISNIGYIANNISPVDIANVTKNNAYRHAVVDCTFGDYVWITGDGASAARLWSFIDDDGNVLGVSYANESASNKLIMAPIGTTKLIINVKTQSTHEAFIGRAKATGSLRYDAQQILSSEQMTTVLNNAGAFGYGSDARYLEDEEDFNNCILSGVFQTYDNKHYLNSPTDYSGTLIVASGAYNGYPNYYTTQIYVTNNGAIYTRYKIKKNTGDVWFDWKIVTSHKIRILFIGNSLTQDGVSYLAYMLKKYYPEISFALYIWYNGGYTLQRHYEAFINNTPCNTYSEAIDTAAWQNEGSSKTIDDILTTKTFDIICMQPYLSYSNVEDEIVGWRNCVEYIKEHYAGGNSLKFISIFHAPKRDSIESDILKSREMVRRLMSETICEDIIPMGLAVYNAFSTELDLLGDKGHLSPDGTHTQEGLPCLLQTFVVAQWIFEKLGISKSVYLSPMRITSEIYASINVPGPNLGSGVITGTEAQNTLAQEIAIKTFKEDINPVEPGLSADAKNALLTAFRNTVWLSPDANNYYNELRTTLFGSGYPKIQVVYNPGAHEVYVGDKPDSLKRYLTVTYYQDKDSSGVVVPQSGYTLSGNIDDIGEKTIAVNYSGASDSFMVSVTNPFFYRLSNTPYRINGDASKIITTNVKMLDVLKNQALAFDVIIEKDYATEDTEAGFVYYGIYPTGSFNGLDCSIYDGGSPETGKTKITLSARYKPGAAFRYDAIVPNASVVGTKITFVISLDASKSVASTWCAVNGELITATSQTINYTFESNNQNLIVGGRTNLSGTLLAPFHGTFNDFRVYNRSVNEAEALRYIEEVNYSA